MKGIPTVSSSNSDRVYRLGGRIGKGTRGTVYLATSDNENYAIKFIKKKHGKRTLSLIEKEVLPRCSKCNSVMKLLDVVKLSGRLGLVYEYMDGDLYKLREEIAKPLYDQPELILAIIYSISRALDVLHSNGKYPVCHGDVKLENILYRKTNDRYEFKLCDFDLLNGNEEGMGELQGTIAFFCPQYIFRSKYNDDTSVPIKICKRNDWWALGCAMYELYSSNDVFDEIYDKEKEVDVEKVVGLPYIIQSKLPFETPIQKFLADCIYTLFEAKNLDLPCRILENYPEILHILK